MSVAKREIAIGVVTYGKCETLFPRLQKAAEAGFAIYLFDNSPDICETRNFCKDVLKEKVKYITCGKNIGLGYGISAISAQAYYDAHKAMIFFDQDTVFNNSTLDFVENYFAKNSDKLKNYSAVVFNAKNIPVLQDAIFIISSGSLFILDNVKKMNWHNENYFVDCVDYEFCLRSDNFGFKVGELGLVPGFDHQSEQPDAVYKVFGKERMLRKYSTRRVKDAVKGSLKLIFSSLASGNLKYFLASIKSFIGYCLWQFLVRVLIMTKSGSGKRYE